MEFTPFSPSEFVTFYWVTNTGGVGNGHFGDKLFESHNGRESSDGGIFIF